MGLFPLNLKSPPLFSSRDMQNHPKTNTGGYSHEISYSALILINEQGFFFWKEQLVNLTFTIEYWKFSLLSQNFIIKLSGRSKGMVFLLEKSMIYIIVTHSLDWVNVPYLMGQPAQRNSARWSKIIFSFRRNFVS